MTSMIKCVPSLFSCNKQGWIIGDYRFNRQMLVTVDSYCWSVSPAAVTGKARKLRKDLIGLSLRIRVNNLTIV